MIAHTCLPPRPCRLFGSERPSPSQTCTMRHTIRASAAYTGDFGCNSAKVGRREVRLLPLHRALPESNDQTGCVEGLKAFL